MSRKVKWGILSTAKIGEEYVIPALQGGRFSEVTAIASRNADSANRMADLFDIPDRHGSYEELLADANVAAVYIPLPNHMHTEWAIKAMRAGKHILCEKPLAMSIADIRQMIETFQELRALFETMGVVPEQDEA